MKALHVGQPSLGDIETFKGYVDGIWDRRWMTNNGPLVQELEQEIEDFLEVEHCICVSSGTSGLEIVARALQIHRLYRRVIIPSFTFIATANAFSWIGFHPDFADVDPVTHNIDPEDVLRRITPDTCAICAVHLWGCACDVEALTDIAETNHIPLIFDASHAFGCRWNGEPIAGLGTCSVFSLHATKIFHTGEGGVITTRDSDLAERCRQLRNFGFTGIDAPGPEGMNGKMSELHAALGLCNLARLHETMDAHRDRYYDYVRAIGDIPGLSLRLIDPYNTPTFPYIVLEIGDFPLSRDRLVARLHEHGILARRYFSPGCHTVYGGWPLPVTERLVNRVLVLPTGPAVSSGDVSRIAEIIYGVV